MIEGAFGFLVIVLGAAIAVGLAMIACFTVCYVFDCIVNWFTNEH